MLREAVSEGTALGKKVAPIIEAGELVPDELMVALIEERIGQPDCKGGYILDGFPRTVVQAEALDKMLKSRNESLSHIVFFEVTEEAVLKRLEGRRTQESRADDNAEVQMERLRVYKQKTAPLIDYYKNKGQLININGDADIEQVQERLVSAICEI
jgi:adenylate kinase